MKALLNTGEILKRGCGHGRFEIKRRTNSLCSVASFAFRIKFKALRMAFKAPRDLVLTTLPRSFRVWDTQSKCAIRRCPRNLRWWKDSSVPPSNRRVGRGQGLGLADNPLHAKLLFFSLKKSIRLHQVLVAAHRIFDLCCGRWESFVEPCKPLVVAWGSNSLTMDITQAPCIGSVES